MKEPAIGAFSHTITDQFQSSDVSKLDTNKTGKQGQAHEMKRLRDSAMGLSEPLEPIFLVFIEDTDIGKTIPLLAKLT